MFKKRKEVEISALWILILTLISIIIGIFGLIVFSMLMSKEKQNVVMAILVTASALSVFLSIALIIAFIAVKIDKKKTFKEIFELTFNFENDVFQISECIAVADIIAFILSILCILIY